MLLSLVDSAIALGRSQRQVRYLIQNGCLQARKDGDRWVIDSADLPLSDGQRQVLLERANQAREALDKGLGPLEKGAKGDNEKRPYSVTDLRAYQVGMGILQELAERNRNPARNRNDNVGFRVAVAVAVAVAPANTLAQGQTPTPPCRSLASAMRRNLPARPFW